VACGLFTHHLLLMLPTAHVRSARRALGDHVNAALREGCVTWSHWSLRSEWECAFSLSLLHKTHTHTHMHACTHAHSHTHTHTHTHMRRFVTITAGPCFWCDSREGRLRGVDRKENLGEDRHYVSMLQVSATFLLSCRLVRVCPLT